MAGYVHAIAGNRAEAENNMHAMLHQQQCRYIPPYYIGLVFAGLEETENALDWLHRAFDERDVHMPFLLDHKWNRIRANPNFQALLSRAGLQNFESSHGMQ